jgi:hypothetical protein
LLTSTLYVDFGDSFPAGGFNVTKNNLSTAITAGGLGGPTINLAGNPTLNFRGLNTYMAGANGFDYNGSGAVTAADYTALRADALSVVRQLYAPFDVNVQLAPALDNTSSTTYFNGIRATLQMGANANGEYDDWVFVSSVTSGGNPVPSTSGISNGTDIGGNNTQDNSEIVFADYMFNPAFSFHTSEPAGATRGPSASLALGDNISHEAGHDFGLQHIFNTQNTRNVTVANSETMGYGLTWSQYGVFSRYPLLSDYVIGSPNTRPGPAIMSYDRLISNSLLGRGAGSAEYVTGSGENDAISITSISATSASVTVQAFSDANHATAVDVPGPDGTFVGNDGTLYTRNGSVFSYTINTSNGILIDAGEGADWVTIDGRINAQVNVRGMADADRLEVDGHGIATGTYTPRGSAVPSLVSQDPISFAASGPNLGGTVRVGGSVVNFQDFESTSLVTVHDVTSFKFVTPNAADNLTVTQPTAGRSQVSGSSDGQALVPLSFYNIGTLTIDAALNDGAAADAISVNVPAAGTLTNALVISTGGGSDSLQIVNTNGLLAAPGGVVFEAGSGNDKITGPDSNSAWSITSVASGRITTANIAFVSVENLNGGSLVDTFNLSSGALNVAINGGGGNDILNGANVATTWNITAANAGSIAPGGVTFTSVENLNGGTANDNFVFAAAGSVSGSIVGGGGNDTLDFSAQAARTVVLQTSSSAGFGGTVAGSIGGTFSQIDAILGSTASGADSLTGRNVNSTWIRLGPTGTYRENATGHVLTFTNFETLNGGTARDNFKIAPSAAFELTINGGLPTVPPGDELEVVLPGTVNPQLTVLKPNADGRFTFNNRKPVNYTSIEKLNNYDFGDAPNSFGTTLASNGARHRLGSDLRLGHVDPESDGQPTATALGDDHNGTPDDEDGVILPAVFVACLRARIDVFASKAGKLDAWIDYNGNGVFEPAERIAGSLAVGAGSNTLVISVPDDAVNGLTYARFRLSSTGGLGPTGLAESGEVEDHRILIAQAPANGFLTIPDPLFPGGTMLVMGGTNGDDTLIFERYHPDDTIRAIHNGQVLVTYPALGVITRVGAVGRGGNDDIVLDDELPQSAEFCGDAGNDTLFGSSNADYLKGGAGNDLLHGLAGPDVLIGGGGNDVLYGDGGNDIMVGDAGNDVLYGGTGNDELFGGDGDDVLYGDQGDDIILGQAGSDHLYGDSGRDVMIGGTGRDFVFGEGHDDLVVGASTVYDGQRLALERIRAEWSSANSYSVRVANLRTGAGANLAGTKLSGANIIGDGTVDDLFGNGDLDYFIADSLDNLFDRDGNELVN